MTWYPKYSVRFRGRFVGGGPSICNEGEIYFNALFQLDDIQINEGRGVLFTSNDKEHSLMLVPSELLDAQSCKCGLNKSITWFPVSRTEAKQKKFFEQSVTNNQGFKCSWSFQTHQLKRRRRRS